MATPEPPPALNIPDSQSIVIVHVIDTTSRLRVPSRILLEPEIKGLDTLEGPAFSFLIEHPANGRKVLFDLGMRKDWENLAPAIVGQIRNVGTKITVDKGVADILHDGGVKPDTIEAIIWSHYHCDHIGDVSTFPKSTALVVGPDFREHLVPGYPTDKDAPIRESDYEGRPLRQIEFDDSSIMIGQFRATDYFGDGSFYLLDSPGHAVGHMCALCRTTTSPDTFIFLGGDCAHHGSEWRPTQYLPLPEEIKPSPLPALYPGACPGSLFAPLHRFHHDDAAPHERDIDAMTHPFCTPANGSSHNEAAAMESTDHMAEFDAHDNILTMIAHDNAMLNIVDLFPRGTANEWKKKGWREKGMWRFLADFQEAVKERMER